ncbi:MAG TPA: hypothetical protein VKQ36_16680 [Ktedonobacterales bacterium]|nr:hypothetical protein [Ktedonobacterales bacterium]
MDYPRFYLVRLAGCGRRCNVTRKETNASASKTPVMIISVTITSALNEEPPVCPVCAGGQLDGFTSRLPPGCAAPALLALDEALRNPRGGVMDGIGIVVGFGLALGLGEGLGMLVAVDVGGWPAGVPVGHTVAVEVAVAVTHGIALPGVLVEVLVGP